MRAFLILIVLAALGYAGWSWYASRTAKDASASDVQLPVLAGPGAVAQPAVNPPTPPLPDLPVQVPAEVKAAFDQAEALWKQASDAGQPPALGAKAPVIARQYSTVLRGIYNRPGMQALEQTVVERLSLIGTELFFSKSRFPEDETGLMATHQVQPGQNPDAIAKKYGMSMELINRLRGREANDSHLNAGDSLKVVKVREKGGYFLHIDRSAFTMDCFIGGVFARRYPISHGAPQTPTPLGRTTVSDRVLDPSWTDPKTHVVYGPNDPGNILGKVWLAFNAEGLGQSGLGIHGYTGPNPQLRAQVSNGCIRMDNPQAMELYQTLCHPGRCKTEVEIVE